VMLAKYRPALYAQTAAEAILHYSPDDAQVPRGLYGQYAACYLLHRVLWGGGKRVVIHHGSMRFKFRGPAFVQVPPNAREEAVPELWDANPRAYLRLLAGARLPEVHDFAVRAVTQRHAQLLETATAKQIVGMLQAPYEPTVQLALAELERRFNPQQPDWELLD